MIVSVGLTAFREPHLNKELPPHPPCSKPTAVHLAVNVWRGPVWFRALPTVTTVKPTARSDFDTARWFADGSELINTSRNRNTDDIVENKLREQKKSNMSV